MPRNIVLVLAVSTGKPPEDGGRVERAVVVGRHFAPNRAEVGHSVREDVDKLVIGSEGGWRGRGGGVSDETEFGADRAKAFLVDPEFDADLPEPVKNARQVRNLSCSFVCARVEIAAVSTSTRVCWRIRVRRRVC